VQNRARRHGSGEPDSLPLVLAAKSENALRVSAVDAKAARLGLYAGLTLSDARARIPALEVVEADHVADRTLLESIADWCDGFTPLVALDPPNGILLDISGCAHLFGGERALGEKILTDLRARGFSAHYAIAGTAAAARALTLVAAKTIVEQGNEEAVVSRLPVEVLRAERGIAIALKRAGLKTIGDAASRNRSELTARFGASFVFLLDQVLGKTDTPISPRRHLPDYMTERRFPEPIAASETIQHTLLSLAGTLKGVLEEQGKGARVLEAAFFRTDGAVRRIGVETGAPLRDEHAILRLFRERLDALADPLDPGFGFDLIRLSALRVENFNEEEANFDRHREDMHEVAALIDRLSARFGAERVLKFEAEDTHCPEREARLVAAQRATQIALWQKTREFAEPPRRPLRLFEPPERLQNVLAEVPDGPPAAFVWRRAKHKVVHAEGPERIAAEWWRQEVMLPTRDYFRVENEEGQRYWIYREGLYVRETRKPVWFMHGAFA